MKFFTMTVALAAVTIMADAQSTSQLSVADMFQLLEDNSTAIKVQKTSIEAAQHGIADAKSQRLPDIQAVLSASYAGNVVMMDRDFTNAHGYSSPHFGNSFSLEARQTIYSGGALSAGIRLAELAKEQSVHSTDFTRQQQRFVAMGYYLDLFKLANRKQVYVKNIELTERLIADIKAKQQEGMALKNDVTRYELQLETLKLGLRKVEDQASIVNHDLCVMLGLAGTRIIPDASVAQLALSGEANTGRAEAEWQSEALMSSPQLQMSKTGTKMAEQSLRLAKSELLPKLSLVAADSFDGPITYEIPAIDKNINVWYVGVGVAYPLSSLYKSNKKVRKAKSELRKSKENELLAQEHINTSVQAAYTNYRQTFVEHDTQKKSVALAEQNYEVINERYLNQLSLITDMLDASNILLNAQLQEVDARINIVFAYYKMKFVSGTI